MEVELKTFLRIITFTEWYYIRKDNEPIPTSKLEHLKLLQIASIVVGFITWFCVLNIIALI